jgi:hypothetical protein
MALPPNPGIQGNGGATTSVSIQGNDKTSVYLIVKEETTW